MTAYQRILGHAPDGTPIRSPFYSYKFQHRGVVVRVTTRFTTKAEALRQARADLKAREADFTAQLEALTKSTTAAGPAVTLGQLADAYLAAPLEVKHRSRMDNLVALRTLIRRATGTVPSPDRPLFPLPSVSAFYASWLPAAGADLPAATLRSSKISANSVARKVRSIFHPRARAHYVAQALLPASCPALDTWLATLDQNKFTRIAKAGLDLPTDATINAVITAWQNLPNTERDIFVILGLELAFGLRIGEIAQLTWSAVTTRDGQPFLEAVLDDKKGLGRISVRAIDPYYTTLIQRITAHGWRGAPTDHIIPGTLTYRRDLVFRRVSAWLRSFGWTGHKTNHRLRDWVGSQIAVKYGIFDASVWLRHSSVTVTQGHYTHYVTAAAVSNKDLIPIRYATATTADPVLTVLPSAQAL